MWNNVIAECDHYMLSSETTLKKRTNLRFCFKNDSDRICTSSQRITEWKLVYSLIRYHLYHKEYNCNSIYDKSEAVMICRYTHFFFSPLPDQYWLSIYSFNIYIWTGPYIEMFNSVLLHMLICIVKCLYYWYFVHRPRHTHIYECWVY